MAYDKAATEELLSRLEKHVKTSPDFTPQEWDALRGMAKAWLVLASLGRAGKWVITTLGLFAFAGASVTALLSFLKDWTK